MKSSQLVPARKQIQQAISQSLQTAEFKKQFEEMTKDTLKQYFLFYVSATLLLLGDKHDFTKEQLIDFQKELSKTCMSYVKEHDDGNIITVEEILKTLEADYGIKYNKEEDIFE